MPIGYAIDESRGLVWVRAWGALCDDHLRAHALALGSDARFDPHLPLLADLRDASATSVTSGFLRGFRSPMRRDTRRALIVGDNATFGLARMYGMLTSDDESVNVVWELAAALEWLGLPADWAAPERLDATFGVEPDRAEDLPA